MFNVRRDCPLLDIEVCKIIKGSQGQYDAHNLTLPKFVFENGVVNCRKIDAQMRKCLKNV